MFRYYYIITAISILICFANNAHAEFMIGSAILEFDAEGPRQQDIEIISRSKENDYIVSEISEIRNPGLPDETRVAITDPAKSGLLVTPDKTILTGRGRKILRFILLKEPDDKEHIYRVAIKPVIKGVQGNIKIGLKILIGYEVLVIVRPQNTIFATSAGRKGKSFSVINNGNTNVIFQNGKQCISDNDCNMPPVIRVYPGEKKTVELQYDAPAWYSIWDGKNTIEKQF